MQSFSILSLGLYFLEKDNWQKLFLNFGKLST